MNMESVEVLVTLENITAINAPTYLLMKLYRALSITTVVRIPECRNLLKEEMTWFSGLAEGVENIPAVVFLFLPDKERDYPIVYANAFTEEATPYKRNELLGCQNAFLKDVPADIVEAMCSGTPSVQTHSMQCYDVEIAVSTASKPIFDSEGRLRYILSFQSEESLPEDLRTLIMVMLTTPNVIPASGGIKNSYISF
jgi:hypothetical protein